jgi:hypothetical protein
MAMYDLANAKVSLLISDPWDFVTDHGSGPFLGQILQVGPDYWLEKFANRSGKTILIQLSTPLTIEGTRYEYLIASPRHETGDISQLLQGLEVICGISCIPQERATGSTPFDLSWWRGGIGLIGTVKIV